MCSTIARLADGSNTFRTRLGAASWIRSFVFSHGSQSQHTALSEGIVPALVECLREYGPASTLDEHAQNDALDGFGSLLMVVLLPELPNDPSREAFALAEGRFERQEYLDASLAYTQAIHAKHPDLRGCFLRRGECYAALGRAEESAQDYSTAAASWLAYCRGCEEVVRTMLALEDEEDPELEVYIATSIGYAFRGLAEADTALVREAFQKVVDVADKACSERHSAIMIDVGPGKNVRWQRAAYDVVYSVAREPAVAAQISEVIVPGLGPKDRYTLFTCAISALHLKDELGGGIDAEDSAVATWAFGILGAALAAAKPAPLPAAQQQQPVPAIEDAPAAADPQAGPAALTLEVAEPEPELEPEDASALARQVSELKSIDCKYLKMDAIHVTGWVLAHPSCIDKGSMSDMVASAVPLLVWAATGSPHMQQVVLGETRIFHELFGGIPVRPASFWGTANLLISLLEDMTVSRAPSSARIMPVHAHRAVTTCPPPLLGACSASTRRRCPSGTPTNSSNT